MSNIMEGRQLLQYIIDTSDVVLAKKQEATGYLASLCRPTPTPADGAEPEAKKMRLEYISVRKSGLTPGIGIKFYKGGPLFMFLFWFVGIRFVPRR